MVLSVFLASALPAQRAPLLTQRQKYMALREAKQLGQKAEALEKSGNADGAERSSERALQLEEQVRGPWDLDVAHRIDQVADLYTAHKKDKAAAPLYERARAIRERALSTHPDVYEKANGDIKLKRNQPAERVKPKRQ